MNNSSDSYKTLLKPSKEILFKAKKSKFFGYAFPIVSEEEVKPLITTLKKKHHTAGHVCYAWQLGVENVNYRANDDGEPNNSAGLPIYGQIQAYKITNVLIAVARIFGGTKLGVGGLISAYKTTAQMALDESIIVEKLIKQQFQLFFGYENMDKVMRIIKQQNIDIVSQQLKMNCELVIAVRKGDVVTIKNIFKPFHTITITEI